MPIRRCQDRSATEIPWSVFESFLQFSPFGRNVEVFQIVHSVLFFFTPSQADRTGEHSTARIVRAYSDHARTASTSVHPSGLCLPLTATPSPHTLSLAGID